MIFPVASSVLIPEMSPFFVFWNCAAPTMSVKKAEPPESSTNIRFTA